MKLKPGETVIDRFSFAKQEVEDFARLSGDCQAIHVDDEKAKQTIFGQRIVHGVLTLSRVSRLLGMKIPEAGEYAIFVEIDKVKFFRPVYCDEEITLELTMVEQIKNRLFFSAVFKNVAEVVLTAEALIVLKDYKVDGREERK